MKAITRPSLLSLALCALLVGIASAVVVTVVANPSPTWTAPDNDVGQPSETGHVTKNTEEVDQVLTITVTGHPKDEVFSVEIVNAAGNVIDTVQFSPGNAPPVTMPPDSTARVRDDADSNSTQPKGSWSAS